MPDDPVPPTRSFERLRKDAKRWHDALSAGDPDARRRYARTVGDVPAAPTLRDVQLALAREHGFPGWAALKRALAAAPTRRHQTSGRPPMYSRCFSKN